jgi:hypothetical protein
MEHSYKIEREENSERFVFNSGEGASLIVKVVSFELVNSENRLYNLSLGDTKDNPWQSSAKVDFMVMSNNKDVFKVFNTVAICVELFLEKNPASIILFSGSTAKRTRIYLKLIERHLGFLQEKFLIKGVLENEFEDFEPNKNYFAIALAKK